MPYADPQKRRKASRESKRRRRAGERVARAATLPKAPPVVSTLAAWIETLTVSQGALAGQPFKLLPWELDFLAGAFADGIDTAALTIARGNGKTALCAALAAAAVAGPLAVPRGACLVAASSYEQARILFSFALDYLRPWLEAEPDRWRVLDSSTASRVEDRKTGAVLRAIGSDPRRAHGEAPRLILADEPAQWPPNMSERMNAALSTARGKIPDARMISLGTRPATSGGWFAKLLAPGVPGVYSQAHVAPPDAALGDVAAWEKANPSLPYFPALRTALERESARALADPSLASMFRALRLNAGVSDVDGNTLIDVDTWERSEADELPPRRGPMVLGVDLGGASAMTGAAAYWPHSGRIEATAWFPGVPTLAERGLRDGVGRLYVELQERGELLTTRGRTVPVADVLRWAVDTWGPPAVAVSDRYKEAEMRQALDDAGLTGGIIFRGQGFRDGSEDVRAFRRAVLDGNVTAPRSKLIRSALAEAVTVSDTAGNEKLAKSTEGGRRTRARDDVAAAMILAVAEGARRGARPRKPRRWAVV